MNKNGFTLVELLVVIVILAIVVVIAVPSVAGVNNLIKNNMLEKKGEIIEEAAILLGQDMKGSVIASEKKYKNNYPCKSIIISYLVPNYLDKDNENECLKEDSTGTVGCIVDPSDNTKYLDKKEVIIYYKNKRIHAVVDLNDELSCS